MGRFPSQNLPFSGHGGAAKGVPTIRGGASCPKKHGGGALPERDVHFGVAARRGRVHSGGYSVEMQPHSRPLRVAEDDQCNFPA